MPLHELDILIHGLGSEPDEDELEELFNVFQRDFAKSTLTIKGLVVKVVLKPSRVEGYEDYPETFVHLITRKSKSGHRVFDRHRANRLHWIRPILENNEDEAIAYFRFREGDRAVRDYFWFQDEDFLVIMEQIAPNYMVITSFHIDDRRNREFYAKRLKEHRDGQK